MTGFADRLAPELTTVAICWRIARRDGVVLGFTSHDLPLNIGGLRYEAAPGMTPSAISLSDGLDVDTMEFAGALTADAITDADLAAGRYDGALLTIVMADWAAPGAGTITAPATMGIVTAALLPGQTDRWDRVSSIDIELLSDDMTVESATEAAVLAGANLALAGDEMFQFASATPLGPRRFRLATLLRGRRGTETAITHHVAGERFVILDPDRLTTVDLPIEAVGAALRVKALGPGDDVAATLPQLITPNGMALRPLSPVSLDLHQYNDGGWSIAWIRRSRAGFGWIDGIDAPLGEDTEHYRLSVSLDGIIVRAVDVAAPRWSYDAAAFTADGGTRASTLTIAVAQVSATIGAGIAATVAVALSSTFERIFNG